MSMLRKDVLQSFEDSIRDSASQLDDKYDEILAVALTDYSRHKPLVGIDSIELVAEQSVYDAPADLIGLKSHDWGRAHRKRKDPWNNPTIISIPDVKVVPGADGHKPYRLALSPVPSDAELSVAGHKMGIYYTKLHVISDAAFGAEGSTTIPIEHRDLFILRMQAEAMVQLSFKRVGKANTRDPVTKMTNRSGLPSVMAKELLEAFYKQVSL